MQLTFTSYTVKQQQNTHYSQVHRIQLEINTERAKISNIRKLYNTSVNSLKKKKNWPTLKLKFKHLNL